MLELLNYIVVQLAAYSVSAYTVAIAAYVVLSWPTYKRKV